MGTRSWTRFLKACKPPGSMAATAAAAGASAAPGAASGRVNFAAVDRTRELVAIMYQHWDGYPSGVGRDVAQFAQKMSAAGEPFNRWPAQYTLGEPENLANIHRVQDIEWMYNLVCDEATGDVVMEIVKGEKHFVSDGEVLVKAGTPAEILEYIKRQEGGIEPEWPSSSE